jgi:4-(2-carboxyphenyl)-2-oxobut-3-enoate aldolase
MVRMVVESGVDILMTTGTFGECATLTEDELRSFVESVVKTVNGRIPVFAGITTLNTRDTIRRGRELVAIGANGLFVGRPMWLAMDDDAILHFYQDIAEAMPGVPLVVYDNPSAFKGKISSEVYRQLAEIPEIVAAKHVGGPELISDMLTVGDKMRVLPLEMDWYTVAKQHPELARACWSGSVACAPAPIVALANAIKQKDWAAAQDLTEKIRWAMTPMFPGGDLSKFMDYSIPLAHERFSAAGLIDPGPSRPPYRAAPQSYIAGSTETGKRWSTLQKKFETRAEI